MAAPGGTALFLKRTTPTLLSLACLVAVIAAGCGSVPPPESPAGAPAGAQPATKPPAAGGTLECQYFTSGSMVPAAVPPGPGLSSGDYAVRFGNVGGRTLMTVRIRCASYAVGVDIDGETITPVPGTLDSFVATCNFPWNEEQARMKSHLQAPLEFARREGGLVLHNQEWGITLYQTPYEAA